MNDLTVLAKIEEWQRLKQLVLDSSGVPPDKSDT